MKRILLTLAVCLAAAAVNAQPYDLPYLQGKFEPTQASLRTYVVPEWYRDAKFGVWSHWGPQAVPRQGDWYARRSYQEGTRAYKYHQATYGHQSEFGYKDIIPMWKAERWNPEELMQLYKEMGAQYFVSMGTHHDNFFLWNTKLNPWNSVDMGPHKDVVGLWRAAANKAGLYFGVSEHLVASYTWYQFAKGADKGGPYAGVPYDTCDPKWENLYHAKADADDDVWMTHRVSWQLEWYERIKELLDMYRPDFLYSDSAFPFKEIGRTLVAHFYNGLTGPDGVTQAVYTCKHDAEGMCVLDVERGAVAGIHPQPWQTDTSIGDWYYKTGQTYMTAKEVVQMLVDVVSKNGNLLLNIVQTPEGDLEPDVLEILKGITAWMKVNSGAIYCSRPWKIYGEGPSFENQEKGKFGGVKDVRAYVEGDVRFTTRDGKLYAFYMEPPTGDILLKSLGRKAATFERVAEVKMVGSEEKLKWSQHDGGLEIKKPASLPDYATTVYEITLKK